MTVRLETSRREWAVIISAVVAAHVLPLVALGPLFLDALGRKAAGPPETTSPSGGPLAPDAIVVIPVDIVEESPREVAHDEAAPSPAAPASPSTAARAGGGGPPGALDLGEMVGRSRAPIAGGGSDQREVVPPRPVEITWPQTERLELCVGLHVDVRILVRSDGGIERVEAVSRDRPEECTRAALQAAQKIRFTPGTVGGRPAVLWTEVRIDFERKR